MPILGIACPSTNFCLGVDANGASISISTKKGLSWSVNPVSLPSGTAITSISCPDAFDCFSGDTNGDILDQGIPAVCVQVGMSPTSTGPRVADISCASSQVCTAIDTNGRALSTTSGGSNKGSGWTVQSIDGVNPLSVISCPSAYLCVAGDTLGNVSTYNVSAETTTYTYGDGKPGDVTAVTDPLGHVMNSAYDSYGDVSTTTTHPNPSQSDTTQVVYDVLGRKVCESNPVAYAHGSTCPAAGQPPCRQHDHLGL